MTRAHPTLDAALAGLRARRLGIARIADITGLDRLGIPVFSAVKDNFCDTITVYSGKGLTPAAAELSAVMECLERTAAGWDMRRVHIAAPAQLAGAYWPPEIFTEARHRPPPRRLAWVRARRLDTPGLVWVPAELAFNGRAPRSLRPRAFRVATSNGLACAFALDKALAAALSEIAERHIVSLYDRHEHDRGLALLRALGRQFGLSLPTADMRARPVAHGTLPRTARRLAERFRGANVPLTVKALPNALGLPLFAAAACEEVAPGEVLATAGYGLDRDPATAVVRAILEVAQSRATDRQGAREDCGATGKARLAAVPRDHWLLTEGKAIDFAAAFPRTRATRGGALADVLAALRRGGLSRAAYVRFPVRPGIFAVRVLVPGAETWHATIGRSRAGRPAPVRPTLARRHRGLDATPAAG